MNALATDEKKKEVFAIYENLEIPSDLWELLYKSGLHLANEEKTLLAIQGGKKIAQYSEDGSGISGYKYSIDYTSATEEIELDAIRKNGVIAGYWANKLTQEEILTLNRRLGVPLFHEIKENGVVLNPNLDTKFIVTDNTSFNLTKLGDLARYNVLKHYNYFAKNQNTRDNMQRFYWHDEKMNVAISEQKFNSLKKAMDLTSNLDEETKRDVLIIYGQKHNTGYEDSKSKTTEVNAEFQTLAIKHPEKLLKVANKSKSELSATSIAYRLYTSGALYQNDKGMFMVSPKLNFTNNEIDEVYTMDDLILEFRKPQKKNVIKSLIKYYNKGNE